MKKPRFVLVAVLILVILICECAAKSSVKKPKGKSHHKNDGKHVLKNTVNGKKNGYKNETKRQFINRPRIRYFGNRPYIWMKPAPLTQRTIVTTHIPRPPLALPYSSRIMQLLANKYPSLYGRQMVPQGYPGYGEVSQGPMFGPGLHPNSFMGGGSPLEDEDSDGKFFNGRMSDWEILRISYVDNATSTNFVDSHLTDLNNNFKSVSRDWH